MSSQYLPIDIVHIEIEHGHRPLPLPSSIGAIGAADADNNDTLFDQGRAITQI